MLSVYSFAVAEAGTTTTVTTAPNPTAPATPGAHFTHDLGHKRYEIANQLGNVLATVSDRRLAVGTGTASGYLADIYSLSDYYPFGMQMRRRTASLYVNTTTQQAELLLTETAAAGTLYVAMDKYRQPLPTGLESGTSHYPGYPDSDNTGNACRQDLNAENSDSDETQDMRPLPMPPRR